VGTPGYVTAIRGELADDLANEPTGARALHPASVAVPSCDIHSSVVICAMPTATIATHLAETFAYLSALLGQPARCTDRTSHITVRTG
jgi:hypothetical protein